MKWTKVFVTICAAALAAAGLTFSASAADGVTIDEKTFPGEIFRDYISKNFDTDENGVLSAEEIEAAQSIRISYLDTHEYFLDDETPEIDITGINNFTELTSLTIYESKVTNADISGLNKLTDLSLGESVTGLVLGDLTSLTYLGLTSSDITGLVIDNCPELVQIYLPNNSSLTQLKVTNCESLHDIYCESCSLVSLKIENCPELAHLDCQNNKLLSLDLSDCPMIDALNCSGNMIAELDITPCAFLIEALQKYDPAKDNSPLIVDRNTNIKGMELTTTTATSEPSSVDSAAQESSTANSDTQETTNSTTILIVILAIIVVAGIAAAVIVTKVNDGKKEK